MDPNGELIDLALREDIGSGDISTRATIQADAVATATMVAKQPGIISGLEVAASVYKRVDPSLVFKPLLDDGSVAEAGSPIARVAGSARSILTGERVALNFVQRLSGVASLTAAYVEQTRGTKARIVDTRKTTPGMRVLEKAAVRDGGGYNHRFGLGDAVLIKDNHLAAIGGQHPIETAVRLARKCAPHTMKIEVEATSLEDVRHALEAGADIIMLDNMDLQTMRLAVNMVGGKALVEASGGVTLERVADIAAAGVDFISVGALTHSAPSLDISLDFEVIT